MKYTVAICTKNDIQFDGLHCLREINKQLSSYGEILLIEDCTECTQYSQKTLNHYVTNTPHKTYIRVTHHEIGYSRNIALEHARSNILVFVDDDVRIAPHYIRTMLTFFSNHPEAAGYANPFQPLHRSPWSTVACLSWNRGLQYIKKPIVLPAYPTACLAIKTQFIKKHQIVFNSKFKRNGEDIDFCLQITERGGAIYFDPSLIHTHSFPTAMITFIKKHIDYAKKYKQLTSLHPSTYPKVENIYHFIPKKHYSSIMTYIIIINKMFRQTISFINDTGIPFYYCFHVAILMLSFTVGILNGEELSKRTR
jgi:GT2 family glycosyltransferase